MPSGCSYLGTAFCAPHLALPHARILKADRYQWRRAGVISKRPPRPPPQFLPAGRRALASRLTAHLVICRHTDKASRMPQPPACKHQAPASRQRAKQRSPSPSHPRMVPPRFPPRVPPGDPLAHMSSRRSAPAPLQSSGRQGAERKARLHLIPEQDVPLAPHKPQHPWPGRKPGKPSAACFRAWGSVPWFGCCPPAGSGGWSRGLPGAG